MTTAKTIATVVLDSGGTNEISVYTTQCEKILSKILVKITPPTSTANYSVGKKDTKIVDLLRVETRFTVNGYIDSANETKIETLMTKGGIFTMLWKGVSYEINFEKIAITNRNSDEQDETTVMFTALVGIDL